MKIKLVTKIINATYRLKRKFSVGERKNKVVSFKKDVWQTDKFSKAFVQGSDGNLVGIADVMDKEVNSFFLQNCNEHDHVLDVGCGHGIVSEFLAMSNIRVSAIDISQKLLDEFKNRINGKNLPISIYQGDAYHLPFEDNTFEKIVARMFLPHFPDWDLILKEMTRVTKHDGLILIHFPSKENSTLGVKLGQSKCNYGSAPNLNNAFEYYAEVNESELLKIGRKLGLILKSRTPVTFFAHNRILGHQLGTKLNNKYHEELAQQLSDSKVKDFVIWFDGYMAKAMPDISHSSIIKFQKK